MYQAYAHQLLNQKSQAQNAFYTAFKNSNDEKTSCEAKLNLIYDSYLSGNEFDAELFLSPNDLNSWEGMIVSSFLEKKEGSYQKALKTFLNSSKTPIAYPLLTNKIQTHFDLKEQTFYLADLYLCTHQYEMARNLIDQSVPSLLQKEPQALFLYGKSYLYEANDQPIDQALSSYLLAFETFCRVPLWQNDLQSIKLEILNHYEKTLTLFIEKAKIEEIDLLMTFASPLGANLESIADLFISKIKEEIKNNHIEAIFSMAQKITQISQHSSFKTQLAEVLQVYIQQLIDQNQIEEFKKCYEIPHFKTSLRPLYTD